MNSKVKLKNRKQTTRMTIDLPTDVEELLVTFEEVTGRKMRKAVAEEILTLFLRYPKEQAIAIIVEMKQYQLEMKKRG